MIESRATQHIQQSDKAMGKKSSYSSKTPDENGIIQYSEAENEVWHDLLKRQEKLLPGRVCHPYLDGLNWLDLPRDRVPQLGEVNARLVGASGFGVAAVAALISPEKFFGLLADRRFPIATFIRRRDDFDYLQEPDIFHEIYGHCPLLAHPTYAAFLQKFGEMALSVGKPYLWYLQRLFWFTVEFGLVESSEGLRIYGAGIASSPGETRFALESDKPERRPFDPLAVFRTPYRIDIFQTVYYVINDFQQLLSVFDQDIRPLIDDAKRLGQFAPTFRTDGEESAA